MTLVSKTHVGRLGMFKVIKKIIQEDKKLVEKGDYYFKNGNYKNAIYYYRKALEINEDNEDAKRGIALIHEDILFRRGLKLFNLSDYSNAILEFEKLLKLNPNNSNAMEKLEGCKRIIKLTEEAEALYNSGQFKESKKLFEEILKINPKDKYAIEMVNKLSIIIDLIDDIFVLYEDGNYADIMEKLEELSSISPDNEHITQLIAEIKEKISKKFLVEKFIEGKRLFKTENYEEALPKFEEIHESCPDNEKVGRYLKKTKKILKLKEESAELYRVGNYDEAVEKLSEMMELQPNSTYPLINIPIITEMAEMAKKAEFFHKKKDFNNALRVYREILKLNPYDRNARDKVSETYEYYVNKIHSMNFENYKEIFNECELAMMFNKEILEEYLKTLKDLIVIDGCEDCMKYIELLMFYWKVIGGDGLVWKHELESPVIDVKILKGKNIAIIGCEFIEKVKYAPIYAINIDDGSVLWKFEAECESYKLKFKGNIMVVGCQYGYVCAVNLDDGSAKWKFTTDNRAPVMDVSIVDEIDMVLVGCMWGYIYCLNLITGKLV